MMMLLLQTTAQAAANAVPVNNPALTNGLDSVAHSTGLIIATVWILQFLKKAPWFSWLNADSSTATQIVSTVIAFLSAIAVQISFTGNAGVGWDGTFHIPNAHALVDGISRFFLAKGGQDFLYSTVYKRPMEVTPVLPPKMDSLGKPVVVGS
jgi:hypothetical protein